MKREERYFYGERDKESEEEPLRRGGKVFHVTALDRMLNVDEVEASRLAVEPDNRRPHEDRSDHGEQEILHGRVNAASVAVHADQQRHRDARRFPEEVEQEQVERREKADQRGLQ